MPRICAYASPGMEILSRVVLWKVGGRPGPRLVCGSFMRSVYQVSAAHLYLPLEIGYCRRYSEGRNEDNMRDLTHAANKLNRKPRVYTHCTRLAPGCHSGSGLGRVASRHSSLALAVRAAKPFPRYVVTEIGGTNVLFQAESA